ncbi:wtf meiotic driver [Schizosaccharomyces osmophilus]|uniref:Wtf meiotic driver n=1 Tax=Schizosaccharomyces osmophilus TaxID=2545709 RepID=A0AAE9WFY5_9SCHI|nr:wtf meiotic driver [Schizosaccharomyces osmophilus]WBW75058.1 wtf meiotic driver [Schizosaccharomyces osmophilus]
MKNSYTPVSSSEASLKTLNDEKSGSQSPTDGTHPPYSDSYKSINLEMADGSAQESANNTSSDPSETQKFWNHIIRGIAATLAIINNIFFLP